MPIQLDRRPAWREFHIIYNGIYGIWIWDSTAGKVKAMSMMMFIYVPDYGYLTNPVCSTYTLYSEFAYLQVHSACLFLESYKTPRVEKLPPAEFIEK